MLSNLPMVTEKVSSKIGLPGQRWGVNSDIQPSLVWAPNSDTRPQCLIRHDLDNCVMKKLYDAFIMILGSGIRQMGVQSHSFPNSL